MFDEKTKLQWKKQFLMQFGETVKDLGHPYRRMSASAIFMNIIRDNPRNYFAWKYLGIAMSLNRNPWSEERYKQTLQCLEQLKILDSKNEFSWNIMGFLQFDMKDYKDAKKNLETAIRINSRSSVTLFGLVLTNYILKDFKKALSWLKQIDQLPVDNNQWKTWKLVIEGNIYRRMKKYDQASEIYNEAFDQGEKKGLLAINLLANALLTNNFDLEPDVFSSAEQYYKENSRSHVSPRVFYDDFKLDFGAMKQQNYKLSKQMKKKFDNFYGFNPQFGSTLILFSIIDDFKLIDQLY